MISGYPEDGGRQHAGYSDHAVKQKEKKKFLRNRKKYIYIKFSEIGLQQIESTGTNVGYYDHTKHTREKKNNKNHFLCVTSCDKLRHSTDNLIYVYFEGKLTWLVSDYSKINSSHLGYCFNFHLIDSERNLQ